MENLNIYTLQITEFFSYIANSETLYQMHMRKSKVFYGADKYLSSKSKSKAPRLTLHIKMKSLVSCKISHL